MNLAEKMEPKSNEISSDATSDNLEPKGNNSNNNKVANAGVIIGLLVTLICCFICLICFASFSFLGSLEPSAAVDLESTGDFQYETVEGNLESENKLLSIPLTGVILNDAELDGVGGGLFGISGVSFGSRINEQLRAAADDDSIKGVVFRINSPGGTVTGSNAIAEGIEYYKEQTGNPVVAVCQGACASGSYWSAVVTDYIFAEAGSSIGSIGVIYGPFKYYDKVIAEGDILNGVVVTQNGISTKYITGGGSKDLGNPYREITQAEVDVLQEGVDDTYTRFVKLVSENRANVTEEELREGVGAFVYSVNQSLEIGLIDEEGTKRDAYSKLAELAEFEEGDYRVIEEYTALGFWDAILAGAASDTPDQSAIISQKTLLKQAFNSPLVLSGNPADFLN